jgi:putative ABC transport system permease protein
LNSSLQQVVTSSNEGQGQAQAAALPLLDNSASPARARSDERELTAALRAAPGTLHYVGVTQLGTGITFEPSAAVSGLQIPLSIWAFHGPSAWLGFDIITGRWYQRPGEIDVNTGFLDQTGLSVGDSVTLVIGGQPVRTRIVGQVFAVNWPEVFTSTRTLGPAASSAAMYYNIGLRPGVSAQAYVHTLSRALAPLGPAFKAGAVEPGKNLSAFSISQTVNTSLMRQLTLIITLLAAIGVLSSLLLATRERVYDLGVFKAVGMTPRQAIAMVTCWVIAPAIGAALIGLPAAIVIHAVTTSAIGTEAGTGMPPDVINIYRPAELAVLALAALAIAAIGSLIPASWAASSQTTAALHAE